MFHYLTAHPPKKMSDDPGASSNVFKVIIVIWLGGLTGWVFIQGQSSTSSVALLQSALDDVEEGLEDTPEAREEFWFGWDCREGYGYAVDAGSSWNGTHCEDLGGPVAGRFIAQWDVPLAACYISPPSDTLVYYQSSSDCTGTPRVDYEDLYPESWTKIIRRERNRPTDWQTGSSP